MSSLLGPAPILDFDGTIARLDVDWDALRRRLGVARIDELWTRDHGKGFSEVTAVELEAATQAVGVELVLRELSTTVTFAVLTSNTARAVHRFFESRDSLKERLALVVGRETLGGPKTDFARFEIGFTACLEATAGARGDGIPVYAGDAPYELSFARRLGAHTVDVADLTTKPWEGMAP